MSEWSSFEIEMQRIVQAVQDCNKAVETATLAKVMATNAMETSQKLEELRDRYVDATRCWQPIMRKRRRGYFMQIWDLIDDADRIALINKQWELYGVKLDLFSHPEPPENPVIMSDDIEEDMHDETNRFMSIAKLRGDDAD